MEHEKLTAVLRLIRPGARYNVNGSQIDWLDGNSASKPTEQELQDGLLQLELLSYREKRAREYPPIGDQLDALWKGGADATAMKAVVDAVKAKYPKPEGL
jgi:hypothetical protein